MGKLASLVLKTALAAALVAGLPVPAAGDPNVRRDEQAWADWFVPTGEKNHFKWFAAYASRNTVVAGTEGWFSGAAFIKGKCVREKTPKYVSIECWSTDHINVDLDRGFEMSPLANEAQMSTRHKGRRHVVRWSSSPGRSGLYGYSEYCFSTGGEEGEEEEGEGHGTGIWNPAAATGTLFGHPFNNPRHARWPSLSTGVVVTTCSFRSVDHDPRTSTFNVTFRIPR